MTTLADLKIGWMFKADWSKAMWTPISPLGVPLEFSGIIVGETPKMFTIEIFDHQDAFFNGKKVNVSKSNAHQFTVEVIESKS